MATVPGKYPCRRFLHLYDEAATMMRACRYTSYEPMLAREPLNVISRENTVETISDGNVTLPDNLAKTLSINAWYSDRIFYCCKVAQKFYLRR